MYKVIGTTRSRAFRVMWMLEELGQDYEHVAAGPRSEEAMKYNALGKIPALVDGDEVLTDSVAIMTYLADKHGQLTAPAGTPDRARQDAVTLWLIDNLDALLWTHVKHTAILPKNVAVPAITPGLHREFAAHVATLQDMLQGDFLMGPDITLPDILAVHCLGWAASADFPPIGDTLKAYTKRLRGRPAFRAAGAR